MGRFLRRTDFNQGKGFAGAGVHTRGIGPFQLLVVAQITLLHGSICFELRYAKCAGLCTGFTTGAERFVHKDQAVLIMFGDGPFRACP